MPDFRWSYHQKTCGRGTGVAKKQPPSNADPWNRIGDHVSGAYYLTFPNGNDLGYYCYLFNPVYICHFDPGYEYAFDAMNAGNGGV